MKVVKKAILLSYISTASASGAIITPALPTIEKNFNLSIGEVEWIVTLFLLGYMFGQLIYGPLSNRFGRLPAIRIGFLLNIIGILFSLFAVYGESFFGLLLARFLTSIGAAAGLCCTFTLIHELLPENEAKKALSYSVLSFTLGIGLSIFIGGIITEYLHWGNIFFVLLAHGILLFISTWQFPETIQKKTPIHPRIIIEGYFDVLRSKKLIIYSGIFGVTSVFSYCYSTAAPMIGKQFLGLDAAKYGTWNTSIMIGMLLGSITGAQLIKKIRTHTVVKLALFLLGVGFLSFFIQRAIHLESSLWFFTTATFLYLFMSWLFPSASFLALQNTQDRASASSVMNFINMGAAVMCVALMGYLPFTSFTALIITLFGYLIIVILVSLFLRKTPRNVSNSL